MCLWLLVSLLSIVFITNVLTCQPSLSTNCEGANMLTGSGMIFPKASELDWKCEKFKVLFACVTNFQGDCELAQRLPWQSIERQTRQLCTLSREAYETNAYCWPDDEDDVELESEIAFCDIEIRNFLEGTADSDIAPCRAFDKYVECCRDATEDLCDIASSQVIVDLATAYVSMAREYYNCTNDRSTTPSTRTTSTTTTSTASLPDMTESKTTLSPSLSTQKEREDVSKGNTDPEKSTTLNRVTLQLNTKDGEQDSNFKTGSLESGSIQLSSGVLYICHICIAVWCLL